MKKGADKSYTVGCRKGRSHKKTFRGDDEEGSDKAQFSNENDADTSDIYDERDL